MRWSQCGPPGLFDFSRTQRFSRHVRDWKGVPVQWLVVPRHPHIHLHPSIPLVQIPVAFLRETLIFSVVTPVFVFFLRLSARLIKTNGATPVRACPHEPPSSRPCLGVLGYSQGTALYPVSLRSAYFNLLFLRKILILLENVLTFLFFRRII